MVHVDHFSMHILTLLSESVSVLVIAFFVLWLRNEHWSVMHNLYFIKVKPRLHRGTIAFIIFDFLLSQFYSSL